MSGFNEKAQNALVVIKSKWGIISKFLVAGLFIVAVVSAVLTVQRARDATAIKNENAELQKSLANAEKELSNTQKKLESTQNELTDTKEQLDYTENQLDLLKESEAALIKQIDGLNGTIDDLNQTIKDLLVIKPKVPQITRELLEERLLPVSELVTQKYLYTGVAQMQQGETWLFGWDRPFSEKSLLATYNGIIKAGIDFNAIKINVNDTTHIITVTLPSGKITDNNIPQETINVLKKADGLFNELTLNDYNKIIANEKNVMEAKAIENGLLVDARSEAEAIITAFLSAVPGIENYTLKFA